jgi:hypothetical protein
MAQLPSSRSPANPSDMPAAYVMVEAGVSGENERMTGPVLQRDRGRCRDRHRHAQRFADNSGGAAAEDIEA